MGINFGSNRDEYANEVDTILPRLKSCKTSKDLQVVLQEEFTRWFAPLPRGKLSTYRDLALRLWEAWNSVRYKGRCPCCGYPECGHDHHLFTSKHLGVKIS